MNRKQIDKSLKTFKQTDEYKKLYTQFKGIKEPKDKEKGVLKFVEKYYNEDIFKIFWKLPRTFCLNAHHLESWEELEFHHLLPMCTIWYLLNEQVRGTVSDNE